MPLLSTRGAGSAKAFGLTQGSGFGDTMFVMGNNTNTNTISYITMTTLGNSLDWGDLTTTPNVAMGLGNKTRIWCAGGAGITPDNNIDSFVASSKGNASTWGEIAVSFAYENHNEGSANNSTKGIIAATNTNSSPVNAFLKIELLDLTTAGNTTDFGDLTVPRWRGPCSVASTTRAAFMGGFNQQGFTSENTIDYVTIATTGNATDFGDLTQTQWYTSASGMSDGVIGLMPGGYTGSVMTNVIQKITIATTGNATDDGDAIYQSVNMAIASNSTRGIAAGTNDLSTQTNAIQYRSISSGGNTEDFGDLISQTDGACGASNCNVAAA